MAGIIASMIVAAQRETRSRQPFASFTIKSGVPLGVRLLIVNTAT